MGFSGGDGSGGITKLSELEIDADKNWQEKKIILAKIQLDDVDSLPAGNKGDLLFLNTDNHPYIYNP